MEYLNNKVFTFFTLKCESLTNERMKCESFIYESMKYKNLKIASLNFVSVIFSKFRDRKFN